MNPNQFLEYFVSVSAQVALIVAVTHWISRLADSETTKCRMWMSCFVMLLIAAASGIVLPHFRLAHPWSQVPTETVATLAYWQVGFGNVVFGVWIAGAATALFLFAWQMIQSHRFIQTCSRIALEDLFDEETAATLSTSPFRLFVSSISTSPFCWQMHSPCIVLPKSILSLSPPELRLIIKHETEHLRTGHPLHLFVQRLTEAIFWFHPMVWWASHQVALTREFICDDAAIESPSEISRYLRTLLKVIELSTENCDTYPTPLAFGRGQELIASRARRLVDVAQRGCAPQDGWRSIVAWSSCVTCSLVLLTTFWLPVNVLASPRSSWSPWPTWSASLLHDFGIHARDYEPFHARSQRFELNEHVSERRSE